MSHPGRSGFAGALGAIVLLAGCGAATSSPATSSRPAAPAPTSTPDPSPPPDRLEVAVAQAGVGAYQETTVPVAVIRNLALSHVASGIHVHLTLLGAAARPITSSDVVVARLGAGSETAVSARLAVFGQGDTLSATVTGVDAFGSTAAAPTVTAAPGGLSAGFQCRTCAPGPGFGDVTATLPIGLRGVAATLTAVCLDGTGAIVGGDSDVFSPTPSDGAVTVPVILSHNPTTCRIYPAAGI